MLKEKKKFIEGWIRYGENKINTRRGIIGSIFPEKLEFGGITPK